METNLNTICPNCTRPLPSIGYFCGACLTQFKCKSCDSFLEKEYIGCINCGTPKESKGSLGNNNSNTFRLHETATDRIVEASFSDIVGKDIAGILRDASANKIRNIGLSVPSKENLNEDDKEKEFTEAVLINETDKIIQEKPKTSEKEGSNIEYPTLKAIAMKNLPNSETEWIIVYAFYASNFGIDTFLRQAIIDKYIESNRKSRERMKALTAYITSAVKGGYINPLQNSFSLLDKGIDKAKEIIFRTNSSAPKLSKSRHKKEIESPETENQNNKTGKKRISNAGKSPKRLTSIDFYPSGEKSLSDYIKTFKIKNDNERNLLFTYYLIETLKISPIELDHLYTCYDELNLKIPENMKNSVSNTKVRTGWLKSENANIELTTKGRNKIKFWDKVD